MPQHKDRRAERRANAGNPDKPPKKPAPTPRPPKKPPKKKPPTYGAPMDPPKPKPPGRERPKPGPAKPEDRRREIERRVQEGKDASERARADRVKPSTAPKPTPETIGTPGRSTYDVLRDRGKDIDEAAERTQK